MYQNSTKSSIIRSPNISDSKLNAIKKQLTRLPKFWKERFLIDEWQMILTDKMPEEIGSFLTQYYFNGGKKEIWINVSIPTLQNNVIYKGIACYVSMEYGNVSQYKMFSDVCKKESKELKVFMALRGLFSFSQLDLFTELFSYVIETNGKNPNFQIDYSYQYIKKWITGEIFDLDRINIPNYLNIGKFVIKDQIDLIKETYENLPQRMRTIFIREGWRINLSNQKLINNTTYGICSSAERKVSIRSCSANLKLTMCHEFGHYLDYKENFCSNKISFKIIFAQEKQDFHKVCKDEAEYAYAISNSEEYFAELFAYYIKNSNELKCAVPSSYEFMHRLVSKWR